MKPRLMWIALLSAPIAIAALYYAGKVQATSSSGFTGTTLAVGQFSEISVFNHLTTLGTAGDDDRRRRKVWLSLQKTKGASDVYVQNNVWEVGGSTGWHSHPGHSLIIVTAGAVTNYESDDPECKPTVYTRGMGFVDPGGDHVHLIRNEGNVEARTVAVQLIPAGATRRSDADKPESCPF